MNRIILFGRIDYKNKRSIHFARAEYVRHAETKAKHDLIFRPEDLFGEDAEAEIEGLSIEFARKIHEASDKTLLNQFNALEVLLQFAIAGRVDFFVIEPGEPPRQETRLVRNDKSASFAYRAGREALDDGRPADAIAPLTDAIASYPGHAWALDARADARLALGDLAAAEEDYRAAKAAYPALPNPHLGLAKIAHSRNQRAATIDNCDAAMRNSIPHQPGYWISALYKAGVLLDVVERGDVSDDERRSYLLSAKTLLDRYDAKLRQLGSKLTDLYPDPTELERLRGRLAEVGEMEAA